MPLYEYKCDDCDEVFFELRKVDEREEPIACPQCQGTGRVLISQFARGAGDASVADGACNPGST